MALSRDQGGSRDHGLRAAQARVLVLAPTSSMLGLVRELETAGYRVCHATREADVCPMVKSETPDVMVVDAADVEGPLPELLAKVLGHEPQLQVIVLSPSSAGADVARYLRSGAAACLPRDIPPGGTAKVVAEVLHRQETGVRESSIHRWMERSLEILAAELAQYRSDRVRGLICALEAASGAVEARELYMIGHGLRVSQAAGAMAAFLGLNDEQIDELRLAARMHDLGMIVVPTPLLSRTGALNEAERELVKLHPVVGSRILAMCPGLERVAGFVRGHHERWDGLGYPDGLVGEEIPLEARVLAAAEIYDALTAPRSYREPVTEVDALAQMSKLQGTVIDPAIFQALQSVIAHGQVLTFLRESGAASKELAITLASPAESGEPVA